MLCAGLSLTSETADSNFQGKFSYSTKNPSSSADGRVSIYETVRKCWQIIENIDRVPDMDEMEKSRLKGEAYTIMASRYFDAFRNFGGLCLAKKAYAVGENFEGGFPMKTVFPRCSTRERPTFPKIIRQPLRC